MPVCRSTFPRPTPVPAANLTAPDNMEIDPDEFDGSIYRVLFSVVVPRPIAWISTRSPDGVDNLAPYSSFNAISTRPPTVMYASGMRDGGYKDTARNVLDTGEFVVNLVTEATGEKMDATSAELPPDESEFEFAGVERAESVVVDAPRVADVDVSMECTLYETVDIGDHIVIFGEIERFHVDDRLFTDGKVDATKVDTVGRLGGPYYTDISRSDLERQYRE